MKLHHGHKKGRPKLWPQGTRTLTLILPVGVFNELHEQHKRWDRRKSHIVIEGLAGLGYKSAIEALERIRLGGKLG